MATLARALLRRQAAAAFAAAPRFRARFCNAAGFAPQGESSPPPPQSGNFAPHQNQGFVQQGGGGGAEEYADAEDYPGDGSNPYPDDFSPGGPVYDAEYSSAPPPYQGQQQEQQEYYVPPPPPPPPPPKPKFDNKNVPVTLVSLGRAMQLKFQNQKEFEAMLDKAQAFGVMLPDEPGNITRELCELDPKKVYAVVDMKAALKYTKRLAAEEAERSGYPKDFMRMMNRNKYGKYDSDDDE